MNNPQAPAFIEALLLFDKFSSNFIQIPFNPHKQAVRPYSEIPVKQKLYEATACIS